MNLMALPEWYQDMPDESGMPDEFVSRPFLDRIPAPIYPGLNLTKIRYSGQHRHAQVSAITPTHAILYWPDTNTQTTVKLERFNRTKEWEIAR